MMMGMYVNDGAITGPCPLVMGELNAIGCEMVFKPLTSLTWFLGVNLRHARIGAL